MSWAPVWDPGIYWMLWLWGRWYGRAPCKDPITWSLKGEIHGKSSKLWLMPSFPGMDPSISWMLWRRWCNSAPCKDPITWSLQGRNSWKRFNVIFNDFGFELLVQALYLPFWGVLWYYILHVQLDGTTLSLRGRTWCSAARINNRAIKTTAWCRRYLITVSKIHLI